MKIKNLFIVFFLYLIIAVILTFPLIFKINNSYGTIYASDSEFQIWSIWKFKYDILELKTNPLIGKDISVFYPVGYLREATGYDNLINIVPGFFLQFLFNPITTYNILILFNLSFAAFAVFVLTDYFVKNSKISFISGVIFGFSPFMLIRSLGHLNVLTTGWMVFFIYFFIRMLKEKKAKFSALTAVFYFLTAISFWYYAIFSLFFVVLFMVYIAFEKKLRKKIFNNIFLKNFILFALLSLFFVLLLSLPFIRTIMNNQATTPPLSHSYAFSASIFSYIVPFPVFLVGKILKIDPSISALSGNPLEFTSFIGFLEAAILLFFITNYPKNNKKRFLIFFIFIFFILSLGPYLKPTMLPLPYKIFTYIPFLNFLRSINRLSVFVQLGVALIFAFSLKEISKKMPLKKINIILIFCLIIIIFERIIMPFPLKKLSVPDFYKTIANQDDNFTILDLPGGCHAKYNFLQIIHNKNIVTGRIQDTAFSEKIQKEIFENSFIDFSICANFPPEWLNKNEQKPYFSEEPRKQNSPKLLFDILKKEKITYLVIHKDLIKNCPEVEKRLNDYLINEVAYFQDNEIKVFKTNP